MFFNLKDIDEIKNFLVIGIINKNPSKSVKNPGMISNNAAKAKPLVYVKKWMKTRHAIMFRLSNKIV